MSEWGGASVKTLPRVSWGGEASNGASPFESKEQPKGILGWWNQCVGFIM